MSRIHKFWNNKIAAISSSSEKISFIFKLISLALRALEVKRSPVFDFFRNLWKSISFLTIKCMSSLISTPVSSALINKRAEPCNFKSLLPPNSFLSFELKKLLPTSLKILFPCFLIAFRIHSLPSFNSGRQVWGLWSTKTTLWISYMTWGNRFCLGLRWSLLRRVQIFFKRFLLVTRLVRLSIFIHADDIPHSSFQPDILKFLSFFSKCCVSVTWKMLWANKWICERFF